MKINMLYFINNTWKTQLAIIWKKFRPGLSYPGWKFQPGWPGWKIPCNRLNKFQPGQKRWLTGVGRWKLPKQQRLPTNSCLGSHPISVSAQAEIFHVIGTFFQPGLPAEIFPCNQPLSLLLLAVPWNSNLSHLEVQTLYHMCVTQYLAFSTTCWDQNTQPRSHICVAYVKN